MLRECIGEVGCGVSVHAVWGFFGGDHRSVATRGRRHARYTGASLTYSYRGQDGQMEENGDTGDREETRMKYKGEERDKNAQGTFSCIMYTDRVSNMVLTMMPSLKSDVRRKGWRYYIAPCCVLHPRRRIECISINSYHSVTTWLLRCLFHLKPSAVKQNMTAHTHCTH